jgi:Barrel-sandwich domain of CusB or HlyD membrane-fusion
MIDLGQRSEPYEIALPYGLTVTVKPLTTAGMAAAQAAARRAVEAIERQVRERMEVGLELNGLPDLSADGERDGFYQAQLIRELAVRHVVSWTGVELGGGPAPPTLETRAIEVGELATPGRAVAVLVDLSRMDLKVFIPEKDIGKVELDDPARVRVDAFPDRLFEPSVARVDQRAQFTPRDIHMPEERVRLVFGVTLSLDNPDGVLKPGMPADAWILWQEDAPWPEHLIVPR